MKTMVVMFSGSIVTNLRADANVRPFRYPTCDQIYDESSIVTDPVTIFNPENMCCYDIAWDQGC